MDTIQILHTLGIEDTDTHRVKYIGYRYSSPLSIRKNRYSIWIHSRRRHPHPCQTVTCARAVRHLPLMRGLTITHLQVCVMHYTHHYTHAITHPITHNLVCNRVCNGLHTKVCVTQCVTHPLRLQCNATHSSIFGVL